MGCRRIILLFFLIAAAVASYAQEPPPGESEDAAQTPLPMAASAPLPFPVDLPEIEAWIKNLEDMLKKTDGDPIVAEELGALYILKGQREVGLRLIGKEPVLPLPLDFGSGPATSVDRPLIPMASSLKSAADLASFGVELSQSDDSDMKAAGIYLLVMSDRPAEAEQALKKLSDKLPVHDWLKVLLLQRTGQAVQSAYEARLWADNIDATSPLKLHHLTFIDASFPVAFGRYQELPKATLLPGELALVYIEVTGARHEDKNGFTVRFKVDYSIAEDSGTVVWEKTPPDIVSHTTKVRSRDLFLTSAFYVPIRLGAGRYVLRFEVEDMVSGTKAMASTPFSVRER